MRSHHHGQSASPDGGERAVSRSACCPRFMKQRSPPGGGDTSCVMPIVPPRLAEGVRGPATGAGGAVPCYAEVAALCRCRCACSCQRKTEEDGGDFCSFVPPSSVSGSGWWQLRFTQKLACQAMALPRRSASVMGVMSSKGIHASPSKRLPRLA